MQCTLGYPDLSRQLTPTVVHYLVQIPPQTGRPGVLVFEGQKDPISTFLEGARGKMLVQSKLHIIFGTPLQAYATSTSITLTPNHSQLVSYTDI